MIPCKHCTLTIEDHGSGWVHTEGPQTGKHRCALEPYGYDAAPQGEPCSFACRGHREERQHKGYTNGFCRFYNG